MKIQIQLEFSNLNSVAHLIDAQRTIESTKRDIWHSKKTKHELLALFNTDFDAFVKFIYAVEALSDALRSLGMIELDERA